MSTATGIAEGRVAILVTVDVVGLSYLLGDSKVSTVTSVDCHRDREGHGVFLPFFSFFWVFLCFVLSFFPSFVLCFCLSSQILFVSFFLCFFIFFISLFRSVFVCFLIHIVLLLFVCFFLSFVRGAKNQEPLKARTSRKFSRGEPNQARAKPLKKKTWPNPKS